MRDDIYKIFRHENKVVVLSYDIDPLDPRGHWDQSGILWCWHRNYNKLGDPDTVKRFNTRFDKDLFDPSKHESWGAIADALYKEHKAVTVRSVFLLDHSGLRLSLSDFRDRWDSGQVGLIWYPREGLNALGYKRATKRAIEKADEVLESEIKVQDHYISGAVFGWQLYENVNLNEDRLSRLTPSESCWGYYGYDEEKAMLEAALGSSEAAKSAEELPERDARELAAA